MIVYSQVYVMEWAKLVDIESCVCQQIVIMQGYHTVNIKQKVAKGVSLQGVTNRA